MQEIKPIYTNTDLEKIEKILTNMINKIDNYLVDNELQLKTKI